MKKIAFLVGLAAGFLPFQARAINLGDVKYYAQPSVLFVFPGDFKNTVGGAVAVGASFSGRHSVEVEAIQFTAKAEGVPAFEIDNTQILVGYKYHLPLNEKFYFYAGGQIGMTLEDLSFPAGYTFTFSGDKGDSAFTWGIQGGLNYALSERFVLDAGVRVFNINETRYTKNGDIEMINLGVKFIF